MTDEEIKALIKEWAREHKVLVDRNTKTGAVIGPLVKLFRQAQRLERERCKDKIKALRDDHCAGTNGECSMRLANPDLVCDLPDKRPVRR